MSTFKQGQAVEDYIFPLTKARRISGNHYLFDKLVGTAFFIGQEGYAMTAAHVIEQCFDGNAQNEVVLAFFWEAEKQEWFTVEIIDWEKHPSEDVGVIKVPGDGWRSKVILEGAPQQSSLAYACWGYPIETSSEARQLYPQMVEKMDLVYTQGYIRRRISRELYPTVIFRGRQFYELSEQVGHGNSGAPVLIRREQGGENWDCIGVYIGEKERGTVSYAVRAEAFTGWIPEMVGKELGEI
ncbi:MAG: serine protease [Bacteroidota bacterium]